MINIVSLAVIAIWYVIYCGLTTAVASAAHGQQYGKKVFVVLLHILATPLVAPFFWCIFRLHPQANAELNLFGDDVGNYEAVRKAYYIWPLSIMMENTIRYCMTNPWPNFGEKPSRAQQELCGGFVVGSFLGFATSPILLILLKLLGEI